MPRPAAGAAPRPISRLEWWLFAAVVPPGLLLIAAAQSGSLRALGFS